MWDVTSIRAIFSGKTSIPLPLCGFWGTQSFMRTPKIRRSLRNQPATLTGVLDTKPYTNERERSWIFRTCGYGHGAECWSELISTLRMFGYDYVLSIEHEDSLLSPQEGLTKAANFLNEIVVREKPGAACGVHGH